MTIDSQLNEQIMDYLARIMEEQKKALLLIVQSFAATAEEETDHTHEYAAELERRAEEMISGRVKDVYWEEVKQRARASVKSTS